VPELASEARTRLRLGKGGYRREHVRAFAQHAEIADDAIYIKVSKKHPIEHAGSHQRREVGWNRRSRFFQSGGGDGSGVEPSPARNALILFVSALVRSHKWLDCD